MKKVGRLIIEVKDKNGNLLDKRIEDMHSYNHNWAALLTDLLQHRAYYELVVQGNGNFSSAVTVDQNTPLYVVSVGKSLDNGIVNVTEEAAKSIGIVLGDSNNQFSVTDNSLIQRVDPTKLVPQDMSEPVIKDNYPNTGQVTIVYTRNFINQSGSDVKFNQVGLWVMVYALQISNGKYNGSQGGTIEVIFDKLSQEVTVPNNATVTVTMELTFN